MSMAMVALLVDVLKIIGKGSPQLAYMHGRL